MAGNIRTVYPKRHSWQTWPMRWFIDTISFDTISPFISTWHEWSRGWWWSPSGHGANERLNCWGVKPLEYFQHSSLSWCHFLRLYCQRCDSSRCCERMIIWPRFLEPITIAHSVIVTYCTLDRINQFWLGNVTATNIIGRRGGSSWKISMNNLFVQNVC